MARWAVSKSNDYDPNPIVVRDFDSEPQGRVLCIIARDNVHEAELIAQYLCDLLNGDDVGNRIK